MINNNYFTIESITSQYPDARLPVKPRNKRKKVVLLPIRPLKIDEEADYDSDGWNKDEDYEVQKVMDVRFHRNGKREFLIRWKGYSSNRYIKCLFLLTINQCIDFE